MENKNLRSVSFEAYFNSSKKKKWEKVSCLKLKLLALPVYCGMGSFNTVTLGGQHSLILILNLSWCWFFTVQGFLNFSTEIKQGKISGVLGIPCYLHRLIVIAIHSFSPLFIFSISERQDFLFVCRKYFFLQYL